MFDQNETITVNEMGMLCDEKYIFFQLGCQRLSRSAKNGYNKIELTRNF